mmetsp:Transcript_57218/g.170594  ORF Transcript_57218/g.170594 Transcript_57218/m.170594 type:complete len:240 (-) Transcript_57218:412-1131(-)
MLLQNRKLTRPPNLWVTVQPPPKARRRTAIATTLTRRRRMKRRIRPASSVRPAPSSRPLPPLALTMAVTAPAPQSSMCTLTTAGSLVLNPGIGRLASCFVMWSLVTSTTTGMVLLLKCWSPRLRLCFPWGTWKTTRTTRRTEAKGRREAQRREETTAGMAGARRRGRRGPGAWEAAATQPSRRLLWGPALPNPPNLAVMLAQRTCSATSTAPLQSFSGTRLTGTYSTRKLPHPMPSLPL